MPLRKYIVSLFRLDSYIHFIDDSEPALQLVHQQERQLVLLRDNQRDYHLVNLLDLPQSNRHTPPHRFLHPTQRVIQHLFPPVCLPQGQHLIQLPIPPPDQLPDQLLILHLCQLRSRNALLG